MFFNVTIRGRTIDRTIFCIFFIQWYRPIVLQIRPINIQARNLQHLVRQADCHSTGTTDNPVMSPSAC